MRYYYYKSKSIYKHIKILREVLNVIYLVVFLFYERYLKKYYTNFKKYCNVLSI